MRIAFYKGRSRVFNRFASWATAGPYSHCEAVFDGHGDLSKIVLCWSSSFMDGGVRPKKIWLDPAKWDVIDVPAFDCLSCLQWFHDHNGDDYDVKGLLSTRLPVKPTAGKWICNAAIAASGGVKDPWRFNPNSFARLVECLPGSFWIQGSMDTSTI